ncbi:hypothetical protein ATE92_2787 [Ulvibacter sp. MAR_2010_11]|uniref:hypothetical protein n=1 Tax=Ulvibacter sp. MAR_2010_11 TaxID=1250229 RepID=UPI000C2BBC5F|nr:hypothetical protein [Ulvibacter sp. MAR_2010_11]PKA84589.1 hypothetical protein ATE92_2787 [Ulvibacter sp. MAR_2010_11]
MKYVYGLALVFCLVLWSSCRNDFESVASTGNLEFSKDTVYLDTVFTNIGSSTYNLKVYNRSDEDINIPTISLGDGEASNYRLNVDGIPGKTFENIQILAKDSIFIFVETTIDINNYPNPQNAFLYTDQILFDSGGNEQKVELVTLVKDAVFLFPADLGNGMFETLNLGTDEDGNDVLIEGFFLDDSELTFTDERPYVIYGYAAVGVGKTLNVQPGARVHFHANSGILVANTGSIKSNGAPSNDPELMENEIIFEGDRLEPDFSDIPGQWGTIWLTAGSTNHEFSYTTIKNNVVGILMDSNDGDETLTLKNVQIYNSSNVGLLARTGNVYGENMVINNAGQSALACSIGGTYTFNHCTFANYWTGSFRTLPTVQLDNVLTETSGIDLNATFNNCIIYGNEQRELGLFSINAAAFNFNFTNSLIRFEDPNGDFADDPNYDFENPALYTNVTRNIDPVFQNTALNNFNIETGTSGAEDLGITQTNPPVSIDLNGTTRGNPSDAGAYETTVFPEED